MGPLTSFLRDELDKQTNKQTWQNSHFLNFISYQYPCVARHYNSLKALWASHARPHTQTENSLSIASWGGWSHSAYTHLYGVVELCKWALDLEDQSKFATVCSCSSHWDTQLILAGGIRLWPRLWSRKKKMEPQATRNLNTGYYQKQGIK